MSVLEKNINQHQCFVCCLKHLTSALVIAGEIKTGYNTPQYHLYLMGNLAEAQEQIAVRAPRLANVIRRYRLKIFGDNGTANITAKNIAELEAISRVLQVTVNDIQKQKNGEPITKTKNSCRCKK